MRRTSQGVASVGSGWEKAAFLLISRMQEKMAAEVEEEERKGQSQEHKYLVASSPPVQFKGTERRQLHCRHR